MPSQLWHLSVLLSRPGVASAVYTRRLPRLLRLLPRLEGRLESLLVERGRSRFEEGRVFEFRRGVGERELCLGLEKPRLLFRSLVLSFDRQPLLLDRL